MCVDFIGLMKKKSYRGREKIEISTGWTIEYNLGHRTTIGEERVSCLACFSLVDLFNMLLEKKNNKELINNKSMKINNIPLAPWKRWHSFKIEKKYISII